MLGTIFNPYTQDDIPDFGRNSLMVKGVDNQYMTARGNKIAANNASLQYPPATTLPNTMTKAGESRNIFPSPIPKNIVNVKFPERSTSSHAIIEQDRVGVQLGAADEYRDNAFNDWTIGIQYYTSYVGDNLKTRIPPVIYPQMFRSDDKNIHTFDQVNRWRVQDITETGMDYGCKSCDVASASLGSPVMYEPRNPYAPLPVAAFNGEYPNIGHYTANEIGRNSRDWPPPVHAVAELQRRRAGLPSVPIVPDYSKKILDELRHGFDWK